MDNKATNRKRKINDKPLCKYGASCYQKNSEHHKKFKHPTTEVDDVKNSLNDNLKACNIDSIKITPVKAKRKNDNDSAKSTPVKNEMKDALDTTKHTLLSDDQSNEETVENILKTMPKDFFDFWSFCSSLEKSKPADAFSEFGIQLVGVYDLLAKKLPSNQKVDISCHWRFFYDPPEFQTVIIKNGEDLYHIGYFRDDPSQKPSILASNCAAVDGKLTLEGDNMFAAMFSALKEAQKFTKSKDLKSKIKKILNKIEDFASEKKYSIEVQTKLTKERQKKVVSKTFNGLGIVVPVKRDIGYRPLPDTNAEIKNILKKIVTANSEDQRLHHEMKLDELITNVHFANDECDFGMGLELGIDLFCYGDTSLHKCTLALLTLAYKLLERPKYASIIKAHLQNRKKSSDLNTLIAKV